MLKAKDSKVNKDSKGKAPAKPTAPAKKPLATPTILKKKRTRTDY